MSNPLILIFTLLHVMFTTSSCTKKIETLTKQVIINNTGQEITLEICPFYHLFNSSLYKEHFSAVPLTKATVKLKKGRNGNNTLGKKKILVLNPFAKSRNVRVTIRSNEFRRFTYCFIKKPEKAIKILPKGQAREEHDCVLILAKPNKWNRCPN